MRETTRAKNCLLSIPFNLARVLFKKNLTSSMPGSVSAGYGWYETDRSVDLPMPGITASSDQDIVYASVHGRISHDFEHGENLYLRPLLDLGFTGVYRKEFTEIGAAGANLKVDGERDSFVNVRPAVEFGGEFSLENDILIRPYARAGVTHFLSDNKRQVTTSFQGAPNNVVPVTIETESDKTYVDFTLGAYLIIKEGINMRLEYQAQKSSNSSSQSAAIKIAIPF